MAGQTRKRQEVIGELSPGKLYTQKRLLKVAGIGEPQLMEAEDSGIVEPLDNGTFWYRGRDIIAWIEHRAKQK